MLNKLETSASLEGAFGSYARLNQLFSLHIWVLAILPFIFSFSYSNIDRHEGVNHRREIDKHNYFPKLSKALNSVAKEQDLTLFNLLNTGAKVVMHSIVHDLINNTGRAVKRKVGDMLNKSG